MPEVFSVDEAIREIEILELDYRHLQRSLSIANSLLHHLNLRTQELENSHPKEDFHDIRDKHAAEIRSYREARNDPCDLTLPWPPTRLRVNRRLAEFVETAKKEVCNAATVKAQFSKSRKAGSDNESSESNSSNDKSVVLSPNTLFEEFNEINPIHADATQLIERIERKIRDLPVPYYMPGYSEPYETPAQVILERSDVSVELEEQVAQGLWLKAVLQFFKDMQLDYSKQTGD